MTEPAIYDHDFKIGDIVELDPDAEIPKYLPLNDKLVRQHDMSYGVCYTVTYVTRTDICVNHNTNSWFAGRFKFAKKKEEKTEMKYTRTETKITEYRTLWDQPLKWAVVGLDQPKPTICALFTHEDNANAYRLYKYGIDKHYEVHKLD